MAERSGQLAVGSQTPPLREGGRAGRTRGLVTLTEDEAGGGQVRRVLFRGEDVEHGAKRSGRGGGGGRGGRGRRARDQRVKMKASGRSVLNTASFESWRVRCGWEPSAPVTARLGYLAAKDRAVRRGDTASRSRCRTPGARRRWLDDLKTLGSSRASRSRSGNEASAPEGRRESVLTKIAGQA